MKMRERIINLLKTDWFTNFQIIEQVKSGSADRTVRDIRTNPPVGFKLVSRVKKIEGYNPCLEFRLIEVTQ